ncbi:DUF421 domain-containing protein [Oceanobacillus chungangensis]|uniref:DUF421 domain-containing protein n=1 Tax=Oceanobacillus chungangensis TaxID=1229152 RepID=A0A3D8PHD5_9BACI|nr:DUF421 domain-containing protein [Oceanobacillus chungangensis]RDW15072.1 hypothetical protein CWR45_18825 [Oceanobacillus chungangensis]
METTITMKIIVGLIALLLVVRLLGKKELSQITPFDLVYLLVLGGLLEESVYDDLVSVWDILYAIALWAILIFIIEMIVRKIEKMRPVLKGEPSIIVSDGELDIKKLKKNKLESEQLRTMLRQQGIFSLKEVKYAVLEPSGQLSVMKNELSSPVTAEMLSIKPEETSLSYLLVDEGRIEDKTLEYIGKDEEWLRAQLYEKGYKDLSKIYYAEWSKTHGFVVRGVDR